uniref:Uncharacterized protein n=1 Tax=Rhizophora mucronata TaxID=61149 RepID=A0A2P2LCK4_RHIMU
MLLSLAAMQQAPPILQHTMFTKL